MIYLALKIDFPFFISLTYELRTRIFPFITYTNSQSQIYRCPGHRNKTHLPVRPYDPPPID